MADAKRASLQAAQTLSEKAEQQEQRRLLASARRKLELGEILTGPEKRALKQFEEKQLLEYGLRYIRNVPKSDFIDLFDGSHKVYLDWQRKYGFPWPQNRSKGVNLQEVIQWFRARFIERGAGTGLTVAASEDDLLMSYVSQELKDQLAREKIREKQITNQQRALELERLLERYVPIEPVIQYHNTVAERLRKTREALARHFDGRDREVIEQAYDDMIDDIERSIDVMFHEEPDDADGSAA